MSMRVPTADVSVVDLTVKVAKETVAAGAAWREAARRHPVVAERRRHTGEPAADAGDLTDQVRADLLRTAKDRNG